MEAAPTEWVLLIKLDTLPYRVGHENWLSEVIETVDRHGLFGLTGSFLIADPIPLGSGYDLTQKYSNNFTIMRKADWLSAVDSCVGTGYQGTNDDPRFRGEGLRFLNEFAVENYMEMNQRFMLFRHESRDWSVFHVNVWGDALRRVRVFLPREEGHSPLSEHGPARAAEPAPPLGVLLRFPSPSPPEAAPNLPGPEAAGTLRAGTALIAGRPPPATFTRFPGCGTDILR